MPDVAGGLVSEVEAVVGWPFAGRVSWHPDVPSLGADGSVGGFGAQVVGQDAPVAFVHVQHDGAVGRRYDADQVVGMGRPRCRRISAKSGQRLRQLRWMGRFLPVAGS